MTQPKSILTYSNGKWGAGSAPQLDNTNTGQKLLFIHALEDKNYEINGSFIATVIDGKNSRLEEIPYALIEVSASNLSSINSALNSSELMTTKESEGQFLKNFHAKKYRFSAAKYPPAPLNETGAPPVTIPMQNVFSLQNPEELGEGEMAIVHGVVTFRPRLEDLNAEKATINGLTFVDRYVNTTWLGSNLTQIAQAVTAGTKITINGTPVNENWTYISALAGFRYPVFGWLNKTELQVKGMSPDAIKNLPSDADGAWVLWGEDGIGTQFSNIANGYWAFSDYEGYTLQPSDYTLNLEAPSSELLGQASAFLPPVRTCEPFTFWYTGLQSDKKLNLDFPNKAS